MTNEQLLELDGKIACGTAGEPMEILDITYGDGIKRESVALKLVCKAKGVLLNPNNVNEGDRPLEDDLTVDYSQDIDGDRTIFYESLNKFFKIEPPLVANVDEDSKLDLTLLRFDSTAEDSVRDLIVGKKVYLRLKVSQKDPKFAPIVNGYLFQPKVQTSTEGGSLAEFLKKRAADKKAKEEAAQKAIEGVF